MVFVGGVSLQEIISWSLSFPSSFCGAPGDVAPLSGGEGCGAGVAADASRFGTDLLEFEEFLPVLAVFFFGVASVEPPWAEPSGFVTVPEERNFAVTCGGGFGMSVRKVSVENGHSEHLFNLGKSPCFKGS